MSARINRPARINIHRDSVITINSVNQGAPFLALDFGGSWPVFDPTSVSDWNSYFGTIVSAYTTLFDVVVVNGNEARLYGGSGIELISNAFASSNLVSIVDNAACITAVLDYTFTNCTSLITATLPGLSTLPSNNYLLGNCYIITSVSLPNVTSIPDSTIFSGAGIFGTFTYLDIRSCTTDLGGTPGNDFIFGTLAASFTLIANDYLRTNNLGGGLSINWPDADGDIQYLDTNTTLSVTWI